MDKSERFRFVAIAGLVLALITAGIGLAGDAIDGSDEPVVCEPSDEVVDDGDVVGQEPGDGEGEEPGDGEGEEPGDGEGEEPGDGEGEEPGDGEGEEPSDGEGEACDEGDDAAGGGDEPEGEEDVEAVLEASEERVAECTEAAGLTSEDAPEEGPVPGELTGLENAIAHVMWNCLRNEDAPGLVVALEHLKENLDRHLEHEAWLAERKAEREAAKAAREAARALAGHGKPEGVPAGGPHG